MAIIRPLSLSFPVCWLLVLVGLQGETIRWSVQRHLATVGADLCIFILLSATLTASSTTDATAAAAAAAVAATVWGHIGEQVRVLLHDKLKLLLLGVEFSAQHCHWVRCNGGVWHLGYILAGCCKQLLQTLNAEMIDDGLDGLICVAKIFFVEFFNVLLFNAVVLLDAVDDALHADGGDGLLQVKLLFEPLCLSLESEEVELTCGVVNFWIDQGRLAETRGAFYYCFCYDFVVCIVQDARDPWSPHHAVVLTGATIWAICSVILSMDALVGCLMITSSGFAAMIRFTIAWTDEPLADE
jgi:hypothetical protein